MLCIFFFLRWIGASWKVQQETRDVIETLSPSTTDSRFKNWKNVTPKCTNLCQNSPKIIPKHFKRRSIANCYPRWIAGDGTADWSRRLPVKTRSTRTRRSNGLRPFEKIGSIGWYDNLCSVGIMRWVDNHICSVGSERWIIVSFISHDDIPNVN